MEPAEPLDTGWDSASTRVGLAVILGVAIGLGLAIKLRKFLRTREKPAEAAAHEAGTEISPELAEADRLLAERRSVIYQAGLKSAEEAGSLWTQGRKLAG
jgi:hypothetical protein